MLYVVIETESGKIKGKFNSFLNARKRKNNLEAAHKEKKYEFKEVK